jgi:hypothetical protein
LRLISGVEAPPAVMVLDGDMADGHHAGSYGRIAYMPQG